MEHDGYTRSERLIRWLERKTNGGREWGMEEYSMGCFLLQIAWPVALVALVVGIACGRLIR